jgi:hypothetical protein
MPNKINKEMIMAFICEELEEAQATEVQEYINTDAEGKKIYNEFLNTRKYFEQSFSPLLEMPMPAKTEQLIKNWNIKQNESILAKIKDFIFTPISWMKLSPLAIAGWLGFISLGTYQIAENNFSDNVNLKEKRIVQIEQLLENNDNKKLLTQEMQTVSNEFLDKKEELIINKKYSIQLSDQMTLNIILKEILEIDGRNCFVVEFENNINQLITLCQNEKHEWEILKPN